MPRKPRTVTLSIGRHLTLWGLMMGALALLIWRLGVLHIDERQFLQQAGEARSVRADTLPAQRGMVFDRYGEPLAVSSLVKSVWVNARELNLTKKNRRQLARLLNISPHKLSQTLKHNANKRFVYLKRHVSPAIGKKITQLKIKGLNVVTEYRRYYPQGEISAHVVGSTNIDQKGIQGLELAFNKWLSGQPGRATVLRDRKGNYVEQIAERDQPRAGRDIHLSVDSRIQYRAYTELLKTIKHHGAKSGSVVVLDIETGEVLSMVNYPTYNPNQRFTVVDDRFRNRAVTDQFEPGSTIKPFSMVNVINSGQFNPETSVNTHPGVIKLSGRTIKDVRDFGIIDLNTVIKKSSNVGISKLTLQLPIGDLYDTLHYFGFGQKTQSQFPGEQTGVLSYRYNLKPIEHAALSFGYGLSATPLQLASAYATLAGGCKKRPVTFTKVAKPIRYVQVCKPAVANAVNKMLELVVGPGGTGTKAHVPGYRVAGKTGTVRKISGSGYATDSHLSLFAGFAPIDSPKVVVVVVIDEPSRGKYYGGDVAAPLFSKIMYNVLQRLNIPTTLVQPKLILAKK